MTNVKEKIIEDICRQSYFKLLNENLISGKKEISIKYLAGSLKSFLFAVSWLKSPKNFFIISQNQDRLDTWLNDLSILIKPQFLAPFPEHKQKIKLEDSSLEESSIMMIESLVTLQKYEHTIAIAKADIFEKEFPKPDNILKFRLNLKIGDTLNRDEFCKTLSMNGFEKKDFVSEQGDLAVRGGIVDVYPIGWENPLRIEFWGDVIDSLREFNPLSQRSIKEHSEIEFITNVFHSGEETRAGSISDYISPETIFIIDEADLIESEEFALKIPQIYRKIFINKIGDSDVSIKSSPQPEFHSSIRKFSDELRALTYNKTNIVISADSKIHLKRIKEIVENSLELSDEEMFNPDLASKEQTQKHINWIEASPSEGFITQEFAFFTEHQIFDRLRVQEKHRKKYTGGISLKDLKQLHIGDYIVHVDKGVGKFDGFERVTFGGSEHDCVRLIFAEGDKLYVHLNYIHKIQKYTASEGVIPKLSKLGSADWLRKKEKTKKKLKDIARELIKIYALRKMKPGFAFHSDSIWQKEFEASFMFEDTPDQARSTLEVKKDMESDTPMDRLICGDVGFGKTEVAIRAAFKAVQSGKQVAVLVPTTILAQQHYMSFSDRLQNYPVMIDSISRFKTPAEQKDIVSHAKEGKLDILIGTHRILSKDVEFKDLGLLVIDEEHRFGVGSKEKLREMRTTIDTLTLTATPIPRTLNFSLMGARDLSVIETPPRNRVPIITEIMEWDDHTIVKAMNDEVDRGGQVFFVTDKIEDIDIITRNLQMLMPKLRFGLAHGQMKSSELESVMEKFVKGKFDVLVTTKIVESGLDIPNANTMIINRSNKFGLAELYQLRGRVGRSTIQAYCYLIIPPAKLLSTTSLRRLQAIEEFTDLGSGFQLAMRDLEIRGAGNLLGPEQSGFINDIGFELFHKILDEAVAELRTEEFGELFKDKIEYSKTFLENSDISIIMNTDALLPNDYIESDTERFMYYKKLYNVSNNQDLQHLTEELKDRFGQLPHQAKELIFAVKIRLSALNTGLSKISILKSKMVAEFPDQKNEEYYQNAFPLIAEFIPELENSQLSESKGKLTLEVEIENRDKAVEILWRIKKLLETL